MITLYFVRHGQTDYNKKGIVQGSGIDSILNEEGRSQAEAFHGHYGHLTFDQLFASNLQRTQQTLHPWTTSGYALLKDDGLNELNWGVHEGKNPSASQRAEFHDTLRIWAEGNLHAKVSEGESPIEAWNRAEGFFTQLRKDYMNHNLLLCSHGRQLRVIMSNLIDGDMTQMEKYSHHNTGLSIVKIDREGKAHAELVNDTKHL